MNHNVREEEWEKLPEEQKYILAQLTRALEEIKELESRVEQLEKSTGIKRKCPCCD